MSSYSFTLQPVQPFRLDLTAWILRRRRDNQVDRWDGRAYQRILVLEGEAVEATVTQIGSPEAPRLNVCLRGRGAGPGVVPGVTAYLERLLGLQVDIRGFYRFADLHPDLKELTGPFLGAKPPRFSTHFEALTNAIACQQITLTLGIQLLNRLTQAFGPALQVEDSTFRAFPRPEDLAGVDVEALRGLGFSYQKAHYLLGLAQSIMEGELKLDELETLEDKAAVERLCRIKGVGRWTAEYFLLRSLGRTHVFPGDDVGARNNLQRWLGLRERLDYSGVHRVLADWEGYGGLLYFHLLLKSLVEKGSIPD